MSMSKVLVVENETTVALDIRRRLESMGYEVVGIVATGSAALSRAELARPHLVLVDTQIQGDIDGLETASLIRKRFDIPIVLLTANSDTLIADRAKTGGAMAYLVKPINDRGIKTTIESALYRHQLEQRLAASESRLATVLRNMGDAVIVTDSDGRIVLMNGLAESLTGWKFTEADQLSCEDIVDTISEDTGQAIENPIRHCLYDPNKADLRNQSVLISRSGEKMPIEHNVAHVRNDQGALIGCVMVFRNTIAVRSSERLIVDYRNHLKKLLSVRTDELDKTTADLSDEMTKRDRAEKALANSQARFQQMFESAPIGMAVIDPDGCVVLSNRELSRFLGLTERDISGKNLYSFVHPGESVGDSIMDCVQEDAVEFVVRQMRFISSDNSIVWGDLAASVIRNETGEPDYIICQIVDMTERVRAAEAERGLRVQLDRSERMKSLGLLAGGVAHDLNNLLGPLVGYPELILRKLPEDSSIKKQVERIGAAARDAACVIQDLLTLARSGRYALVPVNPNQVITDFMDSASFEVLVREHSQIEIVTNLDPECPCIKGSLPHLSKVIMNLVVNAVDAMRDSGTLTIQTTFSRIDRLDSGFQLAELSEYVKIGVRDTGCGIKPEDIDKIFEPYYSSKEMQSRSGSGLGLSVVYGIVKDHGGYYDVISELGKGTEFILYFPVTLEDQIDSRQSEDLPGGHERILVVDDVESQRELAKDMLSSLGYKIVLASDGKEAASLAQEGSIDLIVLDMVLKQGFDGLDTYRSITKDRPQQRAIIVSGYSATDRVEEAQALGVGAYIKKPFDLKIIAEAVRTELDKPLTVSTPQ